MDVIAFCAAATAVLLALRKKPDTLRVLLCNGVSPSIRPQGDNLAGLTPLHKSSATLYALRLRPGMDLLSELCSSARSAGLRSACIVSCVGSLTHANIRYANVSGAAESQGHFEICSLVGTISPDGPHLHISLADSTGRMFGGHVLEGCRIYTTAEIVLAEANELVFCRPVDPETTWDELSVQER